MKKCLIFLTTDFPFSNGETFIENEIPYLADAFDKVIILAIERNPSETDRRPVPSNVDSFNISSLEQKKSKLSDALKGAVNYFNKSSNLDCDKEIIKGSLFKTVFGNYFEMRTIRKFKDALPILEKYDFSEFESVTVYSYWFFIACRLGIEIKNYLLNKGIEVNSVSRAHGYDLYNYTNSLNYLPERRFLAENTDHIFTCSKNGETYLKNQLPMFSDKITHSYLGTKDKGISPEPDRLFHIVTCSRTVSLKRLDKLIDSLASLKETGIELYWTHIGDGPEQQNIIKLAEDKLGFMDFEFLGYLKNSDVSEYYKTHPVTLFVNVSTNEGLPVSIMEAISFGIPVLATDVGGTNEIVIDGFNGKLLSKDFTSVDFKKEVLHFYNMTDEEYTVFRSNARKHWEDNFNAERNYNKFVESIIKAKENRP